MMLFQFAGLNFDAALRQLDGLGLRDVFLPFFLIFAVIFATLQRIQLFGQEKKYNVIVALVLSLLPVLQHKIGPSGGVASNFDLVNILNSVLPQVSILIIAIILVMLMLGLVGWKKDHGNLSTVAGILAIVGLILVFLNAYDSKFSPTKLFNQNSEIWSLIIIILVFGIVVAYVTGGSDSGDSSWTKVKKFLED